MSASRGSKATCEVQSLGRSVVSIQLLLLALFSCRQPPIETEPPPMIRVPEVGSDVSERPVDSEVRLDEVLPRQPVARALSEAVSVPSVGLITGRFDKIIRWCMTKENRVPRIHLLGGEPRAGATLDLLCVAGGDYDQALAVSMTDQRLPNLTPLPVRIPGAPNCFIEIPHTILIPLTRGQHRLRVALPSDARTVYGRVFFQLVVSAPGENQAGVLTSPARQLDIGEAR